METVVSISALFVSIAALYLVIRFRKELSLSEQVSNTTRHIYDEYSKRKLDPPIKFRNKRYKNLEEIRHLIRRSKREDKFDEISSDSGWHKFSWEISLAMQHVGLLILGGALPIKLVLPDIACMIVTDWNYCSKLIEENRKGNPILIDSKKSGNPIYFTRRHAEWLAFAAAVYLHNYWEGGIEGELTIYFEDYIKCKAREQQLRKSELETLTSKQTSQEIQQFLYRFEKLSNK